METSYSALADLTAGVRMLMQSRQRTFPSAQIPWYTFFTPPHFLPTPFYCPLNEVKDTWIFTQKPQVGILLTCADPSLTIPPCTPPHTSPAGRHSLFPPPALFSLSLKAQCGSPNLWSFFRPFHPPEQVNLSLHEILGTTGHHLPQHLEWLEYQL